MLSTPANTIISPQVSLSSTHRQCLQTFMDYPEQPSETSPIVQLQNFGRHFENA